MKTHEIKIKKQVSNLKLGHSAPSQNEEDFKKLNAEKIKNLKKGEK